MSEIVYSSSSAGTVTSTGHRPVPSRTHDDIPQPFCFVCSRCTDHYAEHDALVAAGLATYGHRNGSVYRTELWDDTVAAAVAEAEYQALYGHLNVG